MAKSSLAALRRSSLPGHYGSDLVAFCAWLGAWHYHYGRGWYPLLDYLDDDAQVYHEISSDQGHLRLRLLCIWSQPYRLRVHRVHVAYQQHSLDGLPPSHRGQNPEHPIRPFSVYCGIFSYRYAHGYRAIYPKDSKAYLLHVHVLG